MSKRQSNPDAPEGITRPTPPPAPPKKRASLEVTIKVDDIPKVMQLVKENAELRAEIERLKGGNDFGGHG